MTKALRAKRRNPQDLTLRNLRALKRRVRALERFDAQILGIVKTLKRRLERLELRQPSR